MAKFVQVTGSNNSSNPGLMIWVNMDLIEQMAIEDDNETYMRYAHGGGEYVRETPEEILAK